MAINVFLVFFFALNPNAFRDYLWLYCLVCYGLPSVPAIVLLAHSPATTRYYGNATVWIPTLVTAVYSRDADSLGSCGAG